MVAETNFSEQLKEVRARSARLRCEAFVDYVPVVCGLTLNPVTLASYNRLIAFDNAFAGGGPVSVEAILGWVWVHHPEFGQMAAKAKERAFAQVWRALHPRFPNLNAFLLVVSTLPRWRWLRRFTVATEQERFAAAVAHIRHLMDEALYGFPTPEDEEQARIDREEREADRREMGTKNIRGEHFIDPEGYQAPPAIAFQAQILNTFRRDYGMSYAETEALPLKRLAQLWREHMWTAAPDKTGLRLMDRDEAKLWAAQLEEPSNG